MSKLEFKPVVVPFLMPNMWICAGPVGCGALIASKGDHEGFHEDVDPRFKGGTS